MSRDRRRLPRSMNSPHTLSGRFCTRPSGSREHRDRRQWAVLACDTKCDFISDSRMALAERQDDAADQERRRATSVMLIAKLARASARYAALVQHERQPRGEGLRTSARRRTSAVPGRP